MSGSRDVTVDPGAIRDFARFLDTQTQTLHTIHRLMAHRGDLKPDFGQHPAADAAERHHLKSVRSAANAAEALAVRHEELVRGTEELAKQYTDLSELNAAASDDIITAMDQGAARA